MSRRWGLWLWVLVGVVTRLVVYAANPGPLSAAHASVLSGGSWGNCRLCHSAQGLTAGCLECHHEVRQQYEIDQGYHGMLAVQGKRDCESCHPEHLGEDYPLAGPVAWQGQDANAYTHAHTAYTLVGRHGDLFCGDCHGEPYAEAFTLKDFPEQPRVNTFLGLKQVCVACHDDIHAGGRAPACETCHNQQAFKPAPLFRHDDYYVLAGAHAQATLFDLGLRYRW